MEYAILILAVAGVWLMWGFIRRTLSVAEQMSLRGLNKLNDEQKLSTVDWYKANQINSEDANNVIASKATFDSLNI